MKGSILSGYLLLHPNILKAELIERVPLHAIAKSLCIVMSIKVGDAVTKFVHVGLNEYSCLL